MILVALLAASAGAVGLGTACAPIFGIVSRYDGPTWCEQDAQSSSPYCDDFDYVPSSTTMQAFPVVFPDGSAMTVTDTVANSLPNSLFIQANAVPADASAVVGNLVSFGQPEMKEGLEPFVCQADLYVKDLATVTSTVGILAVGAQLSSLEPEVLALTVGPGGAFDYSLVLFSSPTTPTEVGKPCPKPMNLATELVGDWVTIKLFFAPPGTVDAGAGMLAGGCNLVDGGTKRGKGDASGGGEGGSSVDREFVVFGQVGLFQLPPVRFAPAHGAFVAQPYFIYGSVEEGPVASSVSLHFDNVKCSVRPMVP